MAIVIESIIKDIIMFIITMKILNIICVIKLKLHTLYLSQPQEVEKQPVGHFLFQSCLVLLFYKQSSIRRNQA